MTSSHMSNDIIIYDSLKGKSVEHLYLEQYDDNDCKMAWFMCYACSRSDYYARFHNSRVTMEDQVGPVILL